MNEKEKDCKQAERPENFSSDSQQNQEDECRPSVLAWWNSLVRLVLGKKNAISDVFSIGLGMCSLLLVFLLLLFVAVMELKGVRLYEVWNLLY